MDDGAMDDRASAPADEAPAWLPVVMVLPALAVLALGVLLPMSFVYESQGDIDLYRRSAGALLHGFRLYTDVLLPYPPAATIPMVVPAVLWPPGDPALPVYKWLFGAWEAILLLGLAWLVRRLAAATSPDEAAGGTARWERDSAIRLAILAVLAIFPLTFRFDLFPTLLATAGVLAAIDDRPVASGAALGIGIMAKLFPVVLVPVAGLRWIVGRPRLLARYGASVIVTTALIAAPFLLLSGTAMGEVLGYQADRGLQLESVGSSIALVMREVGGPGIKIAYGFGSVGVAGPVPTFWLAINPSLTIGVFALFTGVAARRLHWEMTSGTRAIEPRLLVRLALAAIVGLLITNKVFSVQYVVWLLPFAAVLTWRPFVIVAAVVALSTAIHPFLYADLIAHRPVAVALLALRNGLLVGAAAWLVVDLWRRPKGRTLAHE